MQQTYKVFNNLVSLFYGHYLAVVQLFVYPNGVASVSTGQRPVKCAPVVTPSPERGTSKKSGINTPFAKPVSWVIVIILVEGDG
jgi:hypothetical protein